MEAIAHEAMIVNGHVRMYFGPFPALLPVPLNLIYPTGYGKWSRVSGFSAALIALFAFAGLVHMALRSPSVSSHVRNWLANACILGFALGSPLLLLLGNLSIYNEAIVWGLALSLAALFFGLRARHAEGSGRTCALLGFSFFAGGALLSRVTFGAPYVLFALLFLPGIIQREHCLANLIALFLPLRAALAFYIWLSYAKFGSVTGVNFNYYVNPVHAEFAHKFGVLSLHRIPYSFADYFGLRFLSFQDGPPLLAADRHPYDYPSLYSNDFSEVYVSLLWGSPWLIFGAIMGIICLVRRGGSGAFERSLAIALFAQFLCILSFFALAQRYAADLSPFLMFCLIVFLSSGKAALLRSRYVLIGLVAVSVVVNSLTTVSWLVDADQNAPPETRAAWEKLLGRHSLEKWK